MCGDYDGEEFEMEYYFPYLKGSGITSYEDIIVEKRMDRDMYLGCLLYTSHRIRGSE